MSHPAQKRVLIAGASGFIGSHLARHVAGEGHLVLALVRGSSSLRRLDDVRSLRFLVGDLNDLDAVASEIAEFSPDVCLDAAWGHPRGGAQPDAHRESASNALQLARLMARIRCPRYLHTGTCFEYSLTEGPISEESPTEPHTAYGACKLAVSEGARNLASSVPMRVACPRIFYVYGPFETPTRLVPAVIRGLLAGERAATTAGEQVRDYMHVEDVASAIWAVAESHHEGPINIATGHHVPVRAVVELIARSIGREDLLDIGALPYRPEEPPAIRGDAHLLEGLGWRPCHSLESGLEDTIAWWKREMSEGGRGD